MKRKMAFLLCFLFFLQISTSFPGVFAESSDSLVSLWSFNEGSGTTTGNSVAQAPQAILQGSSFCEDGISGSALSLSGSSQDAVVSGSVALDWSDSFSVCAAFRTTGTGAMRIVSTGNFGWTDGMFLSVGHGSAGRVAFSIGGGGTQENCLFVYTDAAFHDGNWHVACASVDMVQKRIRLYVDGSLQSISQVGGTGGTLVGGTELSFENVSGYQAQGAQQMRIGSHNSQAEWFSGSLDEISFSQKAIDREDAEEAWFSLLPAETNEVSVSFSSWSGAPLVKKIGLFESGLVSYDRTMRDFSYAEGLSAESFRLELGMGLDDAIFHDLITGTPEEMQFNYSEIDAVAEKIVSYGMLPYWAYTYTPYPLQPEDGDSRSQPIDLAKWQEALRELSAHFRDSGVRIGYQEVGNEPDCGTVFYTGTWSDYLELYKYGSRGLLEGDPDAVIGGPSTAWVSDPGTRYTDFLNYVDANNLPLDFFSMHTYGPDYLNRIAFVRDELIRNDVRFMTTAIHVNEINSTPWPWNYGGTCDKYRMGADMLSVIRDLAEQNDVEVVSWAQFLESGWDNLGMIDEQGNAKAAYEAFEIWSRMPVDRFSLTSSSPVIEGMASADAHRMSIAIWNESDAAQPVQLDVSDFIFTEGTLSVRKIDGADGGLVEQDMIPKDTSFLWTGVLPARTVLYLEWNDESGLSGLTPVSLGESSIIRQYHYYFTRGQSNYAYFDENTWTARLGMGDVTYTDSIVGVLAENLPEKFTVNMETQGTLQYLDNNSLLGIRLDYETSSGFSQSVLFHTGLYNSSRSSVPQWGTKALPTRVVQKEGNAFEICPGDYAPEGWNGRVILTFELQNAGVGTCARIHLQPQVHTESCETNSCE